MQISGGGHGSADGVVVAVVVAVASLSPPPRVRNIRRNAITRMMMPERARYWN